MARKITSPLENKTNRLKLPVSKKPVFQKLDGDRGLSIGYRRNESAGTWVLKIADGKGGAAIKAIGKADDFEPADNLRVFTFSMAQDRARELAKPSEAKGPVGMPITVGQAVTDYLAWLETKNPRSAEDTRQRLEKHFLPSFKDKMIADLTKTGLEKWCGSMVRKKASADDIRKSKDSANRVLSMVKAALNRAMADPKNNIRDDSAWRLTKPFKEVGRAREVHFSVAQAQALIAAADTEGFRNLLTAGFLTGARYGELAACQVRDFSAKSGTLNIPSGKTGQRTVILQIEAVEFFERISEGRAKDAPLLSRDDGSAWEKSFQARPMRAALEKAELDSEGTFYALRHSYISRAIEQGVPLTIVAENCGTSVRMIETTYAKTLAEKRREFIERGAPRLGIGGDNVVPLRRGA